MHLLSPSESALWSALGGEIRAKALAPGDIALPLRSNMIPAFHYYAGGLLSSNGMPEVGREWFQAGVLIEAEGLFSNTFFTSFLNRHNGSLEMPAEVFADPRPYMHFTTVPMMRAARANFLSQLCHTLPRFDHPVRIMDIGCGDGSLTALMLDHLRE